MDYRTRMYKEYASYFQDIQQEFDAAVAERAGKVWDYYFRGWLPERKDAFILDKACGNGKLLHFLKQRGYANLIGVDISPEQVQIARQVLTNRIQTNAPDYYG